MFRIYDKDSEGNEYCVTGEIRGYKNAVATLSLVHKSNPSAYIRAVEI